MEIGDIVEYVERPKSGAVGLKGFGGSIGVVVVPSNSITVGIRWMVQMRDLSLNAIERSTGYVFHTRTFIKVIGHAQT